jgi:hypothetical protein
MYQEWRKSITTLAFVLASAVSAVALAQAPKSPLALKPDAPDRYTVVRGDTLWSIAQRYTDSPWRWSELWNLNKDEIKNPHRIYPGNVIVLDRARGQLAVSDTVKLSPKVRAESTARVAIPSIPASAIEPFLVRPLVIEPDGLDKAPSIVGTEDSRVILEAGNKAFVRGMGDSKESTWFVYRRGPALVDPDTNTTLGYEAIYLGTARVIRAGEPAVVQLTSVTQEVGVGDKLVPAGKPEVPSYAPHAPSMPVQGRNSAKRAVSRSSRSTAASRRAWKSAMSSPCTGRERPSSSARATRPARRSRCRTSGMASRLCFASSTAYPTRW